MDDERARGAAGAMTDRAESGAQPQQLVLWSALRDDDGEKSRRPRDLADRAASKFLLIEPVGPRAAAPAREIKADHEIRPPGRDEFMDPQPTTPALALWVQCALLVGALAVGLSLGWIGGSVSWRFFAAAPAPVQQADASACAREGGCAAVKADREASPKIAGPRARIAARGTQQASASRDVATTSSIAAQEGNKIVPRLTPFPETRPTTIEGWAIREVAGGTVVLQGPGGVWRVSQGDTVPGVGRIDSIVRWGSRWIVATTRGLISTLD